MQTLVERIQARLAAVDMDAAPASQAAGLGKDYIRDLLRGHKRTISSDAATRLARVLRCNVEWLLNGTGPETPDTEFDPDPIESAGPDYSAGIRYGGIVEAGAFRPVNTYDQDGDFFPTPVQPDPRYPPSAQFAFKVVGDSMNLSDMREGMWVHAVDIYLWERLHGPPGDGKYVIAAQFSDDNARRELTVKRLRLFRDRIELQPESSNPKHNAIVYPWPPRDENPLEAGIIAVVLKAVRDYS